MNFARKDGLPLVEKSIVSEDKKKPALDEHTLGKLLEAAFVLQEHNRELREIELGLDLKRDQIEAEEKEKTNSVPSPEASRPRESTAPPADYTFTLAQIVATQHQIQIRSLALDNAMALVTERVIDIARAGGAAIGILDGKKVRYRAVAGAMTLKLGAEVPTERALCLPCIRNAQVFRCADVNPEFLVDTEECRRRGIQSLIAVPIFHEGEATAGLELYYSTPHGFTEQDVHTCQLMAGLVTEALAREEEHTWKQSLATERAVMLEALEKLKPNSGARVEKSPLQSSGARTAPAPAAAAAQAYGCAQCGNKLAAGEQFCGQCGAPRNGNPVMQNKAASAPRMQEAAKKETPAEAATPAIIRATAPAETASLPANPAHPTVATHHDESLASSLEAQMPELFAPYTGSHTGEPPVRSLNAPDGELEHHASDELSGDLHPLDLHPADLHPDDLHPPHRDDLHHGDLTRGPLELSAQATESEIREDESSTEQVALAKLNSSGDWSSAASAKEFLEQLAETKERSGLARFWETRRGDIYLAVAVILVACVIRWGIWSNQPVSATNTPNTPNAAASGHRKPATPDADLTLFDRMLISLGLADPPEVPEDKGDASIQVWVDLHTALYYCPGNDLYGKTARGKYESQRDAQLDEFQPAYRKVCN